MNLDNLLVRIEALRERLDEMYTHESEALPQPYPPELMAIAFTEVNTALREVHSELKGVSEYWQMASTECKQAEVSLTESERRFRTIFNNTFQLTGLLTPEGILLEVNQAALDFIGGEADAVIGQPFWEVPCWSFSPTVQAQLQAAIASSAAGAFVRYEVEIPDANGFLHSFDFSLKPLKDETGQVVLLIPEGRNITEIKQTQAALIESEARLQAIVDKSPLSIYLKDLQGRYLLINPEAERLSGFSKEQLIGKTGYQILPRTVADKLRANDQEVLDTLTPLVREEVLPTQDGQCTYITVKFPLFDANGIPNAICGISTDITERKRAEAALRQANEELELRVQERTTTLSETNRKLEAEIGDRKQTEAALRRSEERFRTSIENMLDCFGIYTSIRDQLGTIVDFRTEYVNAAACENNQMTKQQMIGKGLCEFLPNHRDTELFDEYVRVVETGVPLSKEDLIYEDVYGGGVCLKRAFDIRLAKLGDGFVATWRDISDRKQAEEALARREQEFKALVENASDVIARYDRELRHVYVNPAVETATGLPPEAFIGRTNLELGMSEEAVSIWCQTLQTVFETGCEQEFEFDFLTPNGVKYYQSRLVPEFAQDGITETILNISRDITERKLAESALRESEERFRSLSACSPVGIFETNIAGRCLYTNPRYQEICGCTLEESLGEGWLQFVHPEERDRIFAEWSLYVREGREYSDEFRIQTKEGIVRWVHLRSSPMFSAQGELISHVGTVEDITTRRQAEADIVMALEKERELSELRNSFLSLVSHEFRTPLTTIRSSAELLERYNDRFSWEKKLTHYQRIQSAIERMTQLLDEVLLIGQAEAGKLKFEPTRIDLVCWCSDLVEGMQIVVENAQTDNSHQHMLSFTSSGDCTDAQMDEKLLGHILTNLLSNALKYSPEGGAVQFDLVCTDSEAVFRISDNGIGIPKSDLAQLFESFSRAQNVGGIQGTGLGLAIVKKAVDLHGGTIAVESEVGVGTTFSVTLPLRVSV